MTLLHWVATKGNQRRSPNSLGYEYRIADAGAWSSWLSRITGQSSADLEVVRRTLRVRDRVHAVPHIVEPAADVKTAARTISAPQAVPSTPIPVAKPAPAPVVAKVIEPQPRVQIAAPPTQPKVSMEATASKSAKPVAAAIPTQERVGDEVKERILALVVEKTGYPEEMLDLDLDLEADLGVDTVKQAEMFAAIRGTYNIPRDENLKLRDYPTLAHVIRFVYEKRPDLAAELRPRPRRSSLQLQPRWQHRLRPQRLPCPLLRRH